MFFSFPTNAHWDAERQALVFGVAVGEDEGVVRVPRRVFERLIDGAVTPERCIEAFHLQRTRFERIAERKLRNRQLADDGNVEIDGRDLRERKPGRRRGASLVPLYMARLSDLKPGDMVRAECPCGHDGLIEPAALTALELRPYDRILDLAPRLHCGQCDRRGRAMVTVIWHGAASGRRS